MDYNELIIIAENAKANAYAPYSRFRVGAAVLAENGEVFSGANIENSTYGATNCAERTAVFNAISKGAKKVKAVAIISDSEDYIYPCGICRQVIYEFSVEDTEIICCDKNKNYKVYSMKELLPYAFKLDIKEEE